MTLINAAELMNGLGLLEQKIQWVMCPFCDDEVSKLRPCHYWDRQSRPVVSHVCVECAETVKGLTFLAAKYEVSGVDVEIITPLYIQKLNADDMLARSKTAKITYGGIVFDICVKGAGIAVLRAGQAPDQEKLYNNTYQAWFATMKILENGEAIDDDSQTEFKKGKWKL